MARIELLDFQQAAADSIVTGALEYYTEGPDRIGGRVVPYVSQLKAVTGAGKTPILANVVGRLGPAIVLWTTKFGSVVDQTAANLRPGGKYHHLLGANAEVVKFAEIPSPAEWHRMLSQPSGVTVMVSTVASWNSTVQDDRLNVHRSGSDWGKESRWNQLKSARARRLWIVYDEAHNTTSEQVEQLDDLDPAGFFVASASGIKGKLHQYLSNLPEEARKRRIIPVSTRAVVDAQLLKAVISLADYDSPTDVMLAEVVKRRADLEDEMSRHGGAAVPKAIYVVEASNTKDPSGDARPVALWRSLTRLGVSPEAIAVCTNTKNIPKDAVRVQTIDELGPDLTHIIFNKKLQEGWDDPSVYVCYFDGATESATRIEQVVGRALRQPGARHFSDEDLNTAFFFVNCPTDALEGIVDQLKEELRIYKDDEDGADFEPFQYKEQRRAQPRIDVRRKYVGKLRVPKLQLELPPGDPLVALIKKKTVGFEEEDRAAPGRALVSVVSVRTGDVQLQQRDLLEDMRVRCGTYLQQQIRAHSKNCLNAIHPATFSNAKLDKTACYTSKAIEYYRELAVEVVREYESRVQLKPDVTEPEYVVGPYQPTGAALKAFDRSAHLSYDAKAFNEDELPVAKELDTFTEGLWVRNRSRVDYGIPLPIKSGTSSAFYPDFLWFVGDTVWAIDPTGKFILDEKLRTKLLAVPPPLKIALVTRGKYDKTFSLVDEKGWTLSRLRSGASEPERFDELHDLLQALIDG